MPRVSTETIEKINAFFDDLPDEARSKCALCNETLTHIVKSAEAQTGAGTATVTRELAHRINEDAAPGDRVDGEKLRNRVNNQERKSICVKNTDRPTGKKALTQSTKKEPEPKPEFKPEFKPEPQTWTCTECGKEYPMSVEKCDCQKVKQADGKKKPSQKACWSIVERRLRSLKEYMENNCRIDADISPKIAGAILDHIDFIKTYEEEFLNERVSL